MSKKLQISTATDIRPGSKSPLSATPNRIAAKGPRSTNTVPSSPNVLSPTNATRSVNNIGESPKNNVIPVQYKANSEAYIQEKAEKENLFAKNGENSENTLIDESNDSIDITSNRSRKTSMKNLQNLIDGIKKNNENKNKSMNKTFDDAPESVDSPPRTNKHSESTDDGVKMRKRAATNDDKVTEGRRKEIISKSAKETHYSSVNDASVAEFALDDKFVTEGTKGGDFDDDEEENESLNKSDRRALSEKNSRENGPIRYSKMSEEEAANMFEIRRNELLKFLKKLGANAALIKKKQHFRKPGVLKTDEKDSRLKAWKGPIKESISPNPFIIYQSQDNPKPGSNSTAVKQTPAKDSPLRQVNIGKGITNNEFVLSGRSKSNGKIFNKDRHESNPYVSRNLEASFNKVHDNPHSMHNVDTRSPQRGGRKSPETAPHSKDRRDVYESIKIDLKKTVKQKKAQKAPVVEEKPVEIGKVVVPTLKKVSEAKAQIPADIVVKSARDYVEVEQEVRKENQELIKTMRKKNKAVLGDIEEIDLLIQKMEADQKAKKPKAIETGKAYKKMEDYTSSKIHDESIQEGYAQAAKSKQVSKQRPRSMASTPSSFVEVPQSAVLVEKTNAKKDVVDEVIKVLDNKSRASAANIRRDEPPLTDRKQRDSDKTKESANNRISLNKSAHKGSRNQIEDKRQQEKEKDDLSTKRFLANELNILKTLSQDNSAVSTKSRKPQNVIGKSIDWGKTTAAAVAAKKNSLPPEQVSEKKLPQKVQEDNAMKSRPIENKSQLGSPKPSTQNRPAIQSSDKLVRNKPAYQPSDYTSVGKLLSLASPSENRSPTDFTTESKISQSVKNNVKQALKSSFKRKSIEDGPHTEPQTRTNTCLHSEKSKSPTRISFSDEVKKILKEGSQDDSRGPSSTTSSNILDKARKINVTGSKTPKQEPIRLKKDNKPKFDFTPSIDIRSKMYRDQRPIEDVNRNTKNAPGGSSSVRNADTRFESNNRLTNHSVKNANQMEVGKTSRSWFFDNGLSSVNNTNESQVTYTTLFESGTDRTYLNTQTTERSVVGTNIDSLDNSRLRMKYNELVSQVGRGVNKAEVVKSHSDKSQANVRGKKTALPLF